jgi:hypothetical protein
MPISQNYAPLQFPEPAANRSRWPTLNKEPTAETHSTTSTERIFLFGAMKIPGYGLFVEQNHPTFFSSNNLKKLVVLSKVHKRKTNK